MDDRIMTAYEPCFKCQGSGHGTSACGDPDGICWECKGNGALRIRDEKGRFAVMWTGRIGQLLMPDWRRDR